MIFQIIYIFIFFLKKKNCKQFKVEPNFILHFLIIININIRSKINAIFFAVFKEIPLKSSTISLIAVSETKTCAKY